MLQFSSGTHASVNGTHASVSGTHGLTEALVHSTHASGFILPCVYTVYCVVVHNSWCVLANYNVSKMFSSLKEKSKHNKFAQSCWFTNFIYKF